MKQNHFNLSLAILFLTAFAPSAMAQNLTGSTLSIGSNNQAGDTCITVGQNNKLFVPMSFGYMYAIRSFVLGWSNVVTAENSVITGMYNSSSYWEETDGDTLESAVFGRWNSIAADSSLIVGTSNFIARQKIGSGDYDWQKPKNAFVMGSGLINRFSNCTVLGKNNISVTPTEPHSGPAPLLIIGNGASASSRANAFEVRDNGDIIISKPQGDISMGIYGE